MPWLLIFTIVLLVVSYLFAPTPDVPTMSPAGLDEFSIPENNTYKAVPKVYGTVYLKGNCIYYGNLTSLAITKCA
jgi:hypothetical protein